MDQQTQAGTSDYENLPNEIHQIVLSHLPPKYTYTMRRLSKSLNITFSSRSLENFALKRHGYRIDRGVIEQAPNTFINKYLGRPSSSSLIKLRDLQITDLPSRINLQPIIAEFKLYGGSALYCSPEHQMLNVQLIDLSNQSKQTWQVEASQVVKDLLLSDHIVAIHTDTELLWLDRSVGTWTRVILPADITKVILTDKKLHALQTNGAFLHGIWHYDTETLAQSVDNTGLFLANSNTTEAIWGLNVEDTYTDVFCLFEGNTGDPTLGIARLSSESTQAWIFDRVDQSNHYQAHLRSYRTGFRDFKHINMEVTLGATPSEYYINLCNRMTSSSGFDYRSNPARCSLHVNLQNKMVKLFRQNSVGWKDMVFVCHRGPVTCYRQTDGAFRNQSLLGWWNDPHPTIITHQLAANDDYLVCMVVADGFQLRVLSWDGEPSIKKEIPGDSPCRWRPSHIDAWDVLDSV